MEKLEEQLKQVTRDLPLEKISQGAEALVYRTSVHPYLPNYSGELILKYRPPKPYRHPVLDSQLTKHRTLAESRILQKLAQTGISVPKLVFVDPRRGLIWMENVDGPSVKQWIWDNEGDGEDKLKEKLVKVGILIAELHAEGIVHGDLTTSNILLDSRGPVLIDFGLGSHSAMPEDKAVDLYVLERAVTSTHPVHSEKYNKWLLEGYIAVGKGKQTNEVMKRLEEVRLRGRKRSMVG